MIECSACIELTHRLLSTNPIVTVQGVMDDACGRSVRSGVISAVYARVISDYRSFTTCSRVVVQSNNGHGCVPSSVQS